jgi:uncharacterized membrane protein YdjX (TVP38/TMEM64 family)
MHKKTLNKLIIVAFIISAVAAFKIFGLGDYLTLSYLKESQERFTEMYRAHRLPVIGAYLGAYVIVAALSLPGAALMSIAGGALFGLWVGTFVVSFASAIGATVACFVSRFILRDWVARRFKDWFVVVDEGIAREGTFYLFTLRLIAIIPFFVINLVMGLTKMPLRTFYWVSQVGMLPATVVFVNAGKELGRIDSLSDILSPGLLVSFALLGIFPLATKKLLAFYRAKKEKSAAE